MGIPERTSKEHLLAYRMADQLIKAGLIHFQGKEEQLVAKMESLLAAQSQIEANINAEARGWLDQYESEADRGKIDPHKMFLLIKKKLIRDRNLILQSDPTVSREDKMNHLAHVIQEGLIHDSEIEKRKDAPALLQAIKKILTQQIQREEEVHALVRSRLASKKALEGSEEWDLLYQKTFSEITKKRGM